MSINRVEVSGGLTRDPELTYMERSGSALCEITLAVNGARYNFERRSQEVTTSYISVKAWGSLAEELAEADVSKGDELLVIGELEQRTIEKRDKSKESKTHVKALGFHVVRRRGAGSSPAGRAAPPRGAEPPPQEPQYGADEEPFIRDAGTWLPGAWGAYPRSRP